MVMNDMTEKVEVVVSDLKVSGTVDSSGGTKRKFTEVEQDSATDQQDAKVRRTEEGTEGDAAASKDEDPGRVCASCTFVNHESMEACEMCDNSRYVVAMLQQQLEDVKQKISFVDPPSHWQPVDPGTQMRLVQLAEDDVDYVDIKETMWACDFNKCFSMTNIRRNLYETESTPCYDIKKIERTENLGLYEMYSIKRKQMTRENGPLYENEQMLWHGTSSECVTSIASYGFNRSHCGKHGTSYGKGVYFSTEPCYSSLFAIADQSGLQYMFYSRVLAGYHTVGNHSMVEPPMYENGLGRFNSLVDRMDNPSMFVIFHDAQVYPEFLITFTTRQ